MKNFDHEPLLTAKVKLWIVTCHLQHDISLGLVLIHSSFFTCCFLFYFEGYFNLVMCFGIVSLCPSVFEDCILSSITHTCVYSLCSAVFSLVWLCSPSVICFYCCFGLFLYSLLDLAIAKNFSLFGISPVLYLDTLLSLCSYCATIAIFFPVELHITVFSLINVSDRC